MEIPKQITKSALQDMKKLAKQGLVDQSRVDRIESAIDNGECALIEGRTRTTNDPLLLKIKELIQAEIKKNLHGLGQELQKLAQDAATKGSCINLSYKFKKPVPDKGKSATDKEKRAYNTYTSCVATHKKLFLLGTTK